MKRAVATATELAAALAKGLREDAAFALKRRSLAEDDFAEGFWTGMAMALKASAMVCDKSVAIDRAQERGDLDFDKIVPLTRKKVAE